MPNGEVTEGGREYNKNKILLRQHTFYFRKKNMKEH